MSWAQCVSTYIGTYIYRSMVGSDQSIAFTLGRHPSHKQRDGRGRSKKNAHR